MPQPSVGPETTRNSFTFRLYPALAGAGVKCARFPAGVVLTGLVSVQLTFLLAFTLLAAGQALFLAVLLFRQRERLGGERWLAALLLVLAIELASVMYQRGGLYRSWPELIGADTWTTYVYGPLLWLFVRAATGRPHPVNFRLWLHFLPALLASIAVYALIWPLSPAERVAVIDAGLAAPAEPAAWQFDPFAFAVAVQVALYLRASWRRVGDYRQRLLAEHSTLQRTPLGWLRVVLRVFFVAWLCFVFLTFFYELLGLQQLAGPFMASVLILMVFYLAWRAWRAQPVRLVLNEVEPEIVAGAPRVLPAAAAFAGEALATVPETTETVSPESARTESAEANAVASSLAAYGPVDAGRAGGGDVASVVDGADERAHTAIASAEEQAAAGKYQRSALDPSAARQLFAELDTAMRRAQWWRDPDLDLAGLAERAGYSAHYLSQAINSGSGSHFYDYINQFRVEAVKQALTGGSQDTVLALALAAGFNSKSAFYTAFKRDTGLTPKAFQRQCPGAGS